jgi:osmotically inducible protein OsmC
LSRDGGWGFESLKRTAKVLHEDPSSDSGIAAQKDEATSIERQLAALEGELAHGGMIGAKGPQISPPGSAAPSTNPEQLFAAGWSTCFLSALKIAAAKKKVRIPEGLAVDAEVALVTDHGEFFLKARLNVHLPGIEPEIGRALVNAAHEICPYSKATRGNIDVALAVV